LQTVTNSNLTHKNLKRRLLLTKPKHLLTTEVVIGVARISAVGEGRGGGGRGMGKGNSQALSRLEMRN